MAFEDIKFRLDAFEGPLDLLLHLIHKNKVSIYDIPISLIFEQYMEYIDAWKKYDMDIAGEFITMAAELMLIKSRMLLPRQNDVEEEDPRERLAAALAEYQKAKQAAASLGERFKVYHGRLVKEAEDIEPEVELVDHDVSLLYEAFDRIVRRARASGESIESIKPESTLGNLLSHKVISLPGRIIGVMRQLYKKGDMTASELLLQSESRGELVTTFVALLELLRSQRISIVNTVEDEGDVNSLDIVLRLDRTNHNKIDTHEIGNY